MVSERPDALVCDLDGVVYRDTEPIAGVPEAITRLQRQGVRVLFCSNNSNRTRGDYILKLASFGIEAAPDDLLTSGTVLQDVLAEAEPAGAGAFCIGGPGLKEAVVGAGLRVAPSVDASVVCVGFDLDFDYEAMKQATTALLRGAAFYATNADASFPSADGLWPGSGAILAAVETASGKRASVVGKPHEPMIRSAVSRLAGADRVTIVGDRIDTDIAMGKQAGWGTCLVLSGVTAPAHIDPATPPADEILPSLADAPWAQ